MGIYHRAAIAARGSEGVNYQNTLCPETKNKCQIVKGHIINQIVRERECVSRYEND